MVSSRRYTEAVPQTDDDDDYSTVGSICESNSVISITSEAVPPISGKRMTARVEDGLRKDAISANCEGRCYRRAATCLVFATSAFFVLIGFVTVYQAAVTV